MKKLSSEQKMNRGTLRPCRQKKNEISFEILTEIPPPPEGLAADGKKYFTDVCAAMIAARTLRRDYIAGIERAAGVVDIYSRARTEVEVSGSTQVTKSGYSTKSAAWTVMVDASKILSNFESSNGLNLIGKSRLPEQPPAEDLYDELDEIDSPNHKAFTRKKNPFDEI